MGCHVAAVWYPFRMTDNQKHHIAALNEAIAFYGSDASRRAIDINSGTYYYDPATGNRCSIGRLLDESVAKSLANETRYVEELIADGVISLDYDLDFLAMLQRLHDDDRYWDEPCGLTRKGFEAVKHMENYILKYVS
ncbi:MAG: hypothetical protein D6698_16875 [Gammaproteobacteria bacterium]|nr:MAG: hypothetical protein D6698_16875 [Gammaproteobacteria bacterium]